MKKNSNQNYNVYKQDQNSRNRSKQSNYDQGYIMNSSSEMNSSNENYEPYNNQNDNYEIYNNSNRNYEMNNSPKGNFEMSIINENKIPKKIDSIEMTSRHDYNILSLSICNIVRFVFIFEVSFCIYYLTAVTYSFFYLFLLVVLINIVIDDVFVILSRKGNEHYWFSFTTFLFV